MCRLMGFWVAITTNAAGSVTWCCRSHAASAWLSNALHFRRAQADFIGQQQVGKIAPMNAEVTQALIKGSDPTSPKATGQW
jgi:hypothetical protein